MDATARCAKDNMCLTMMPMEILVKVFSLLDSLPEVLAISTACQKLRYICTGNLSAIYAQVGPRSIPFEKYARRLLADESEPFAEAPISSIRDIMVILRNNSLVENSILQFERKIVRRIKCGSCDIPQSYLPFPAPRRHPAHLTTGERRRFVRIYYAVWVLMRSDTGCWPAILDAMRLKDLYLAYEMSKLEQRVGNEEEVRTYPTFTRPLKRIDLTRYIWGHITKTYKQLHGETPEVIEIHAMYEGYPPFVAIWDHWQPYLKDWVCRGVMSQPFKEELWDESSDEEI